MTYILLLCSIIGADVVCEAHGQVIESAEQCQIMMSRLYDTIPVRDDEIMFVGCVGFETIELGEET